VGTRAEVERLLGLGLSRLAIAQELGVAKSTVAYHARRLGEPVDERGARRYDWRAVQRYYDEGHSVRDCVEQFGFSRQTWHAATKRGAVIARPQRIPLERLCAAATPRGRGNLKRRLLAAGLKGGALRDMRPHRMARRGNSDGAASRQRGPA
jgi:transposase